MLRKLLDSITRFCAWLRQNHRVEPDCEPVKVNLGAGLSAIDGWVNIDASLNAFFSNYPRVFLKLLYKYSGSRQWYTKEEYVRTLKDLKFVHHQLEYGIPFRDETIDYLYSSHLLEHLFLDKAERFLKEAYRTLKKGGRIRICVPDLEYVLSLYNEGNKEKALKYFFAPSRSGFLGQHHYMYDFELLKKQLHILGFINIERCSFQEGKTPDIERLDNRPEETLFVEAIKPPDNFG